MEIYNSTYCVYVHINKLNGKKYVGQTICGDKPNKRWYNGNGYKSSPIFSKAITKYGWDNFEHEVVANNLTAEEADNFEKLLIEKLGTTNTDKGYNIELGGVSNKTMSVVTKNKIRESHLGEKNPMYGVRLTGEKNGMYGKKLSTEQKQKLSQAAKKANTGRIVSDETRKKMSDAKINKYIGDANPFYGKHHTEESKKAIGDHKRGAKNFNAQPIVQIGDNDEVIRIWECIVDASRALNIIRQSIWNALNGIRKHAGEYRWCYVYNRVRKDGTVVLGAISLGYITEDDINE